ncbi:opioid growth factor receptor-related protein [Simkania sp.]|uniref:opioid growth factor receptor-related protein n=1 Tax=Simkania sp. TaxID=34094 RepID=UPI003B518111
MPTHEPDDAQRIFLDFYRGKIPNLNGVLFETICHYTEDELELHHNFIQWLFPMTKRSQMTSEPIMLNETIIEAFLEDSHLQNQLVRALDLMLAHYGLKRDKERISKASDFDQKKRHLSGHNLARIDRILNSLRSLGKSSLAKALYDCLATLNLGEEFAYSLKHYWRKSIDV